MAVAVIQTVRSPTPSRFHHFLDSDCNFPMFAFWLFILRTCLLVKPISQLRWYAPTMILMPCWHALREKDFSFRREFSKELCSAEHERES
jgi:hypothetical protein